MFRSGDYPCEHLRWSQGYASNVPASDNPRHKCRGHVTADSAVDHPRHKCLGHVTADSAVDHPRHKCLGQEATVTDSADDPMTG
ncbi:MAG TPA: hypothetical protein ENH10_08325 [Bacteroidetes bacterium]|nr:hypothetical protein [Bacteroidota bacterium]HEX05141.1 hypothetical protein [Bacteroidota bacterium]